MIFIYLLIVAVPGLLCCVGYSLVAVLGLPTAVAFLVAEHGLWGTQASVVVVQGLNHPKGCRIFPDQGSNLHPLNCKVDSYLTTGPLGKPLLFVFL